MPTEGHTRETGSVVFLCDPGRYVVTLEVVGEAGGWFGRYFAAMMDRMVGPMFEKGLDKLKTAAEALPAMEPDLPAEEEPAA